MTGNKRRGMVLQQRDLHLLRELAVVRVIDRELAKVIGGFRSTTRVNVRLLRLVQAGLLRRFVLGSPGFGQKFFYGLTPKGAATADVPFRAPQRSINRPVVVDFFFEHQMAINEVYRLAKFTPPGVPDVTFETWRSFQEPITPGLRLIPDGYVEFGTAGDLLCAFVEVDLGTESLAVWKQKVETYIKFAVAGEFANRSGHSRFRVLVLANSERRMLSLRKATAAVTDRVFWFATLEAVKRGGLFGPIWLRPTATERQPLLGKPQ